MRFKIEYSAPPKLNKWGHFVGNQPASNVVYADTLAEAETKAVEISCKFKKYDVNVFDLRGPLEDNSSIWCVSSFKAGNCIFSNENYFKTL